MNHSVFRNSKRTIRGGFAAYRLAMPAVCLSWLCASSSAAPPTNPLPASLYSFDAQSVQVLDGTINPSDVLRVVQDADGNSGIETVISAQALGLGMFGDDLDALSSSNASLPPTAPFIVLFCVDENTQGLVGPDPGQVGQNTPYNVLDQSDKGQAAGDQYMSLSLFSRNGILPFNGVAAATDNNTLIRNNYDEGGTDYSANPETSANDDSNDPQDDVDGTKKDGSMTIAGDPVGPAVYYSATPLSPSLPFLSSGVPPSGATIFHHPDPAGPAEPNVFAPFQALGLQQADDINALVVFDDNGDGVFNDNDQVIFSLSPGSPSLDIPGTSGEGAGADLFAVFAPDGGPPQPEIFASAIQLGLGAPGDNITALDFAICGDAQQCSRDFGIRNSAIPTMSEWGVVIMALIMILVSSLLYARRFAA